MGWGEHVIIREPKELVNMVRERLEKMVERYNVHSGS